MVLDINTQFVYFFSNVLCGIFVGLLFDIYRVIRGFKTPNKILTAISDILFWIFASLLTFTFMLITNNANLRYYTFLGLFLGLYFYSLFISRVFIGSLRYIVYFIIKTVRLFFRFIITPFVLLRRLIFNISFLIRRTGRLILGKKIIKKQEI
jgi:spore cortex biosynthesis protein YabQ